MAAIGAVDIALWDIKGKVTGQPVYQLLGGAVRDRILSYTHATGWDIPALLDSLDEKRGSRLPGPARADRRAGSGHRLRRHQGRQRDTNPPAEEPRRSRKPGTPTPTCGTPPGALAAAREHVGPDIKLLHDAHHRLNPNQAARLGKSLEAVDLFWLEDVTPAENQEVLRHVRAHTTVPLAIGEVFNTIWEFQNSDHRTAHRLRAGGRLPTPAASASSAGSPRSRRPWQIRLGPHGPSDVSPIALAASHPRRPGHHRTSPSRSTWATRT